MTPAEKNMARFAAIIQSLKDNPDRNWTPEAAELIRQGKHPSQIQQPQSAIQ